MIPTTKLKEALDSVTTIPLIPFRNGQIDYVAHRKNIQYLMNNNHLDNERPRVICIAGTSLIHHIGNEEQNKLIQITGEIMQGEGILMSAIVPNPISNVEPLIAAQASMQRPPDVYLIMPLGGVYSSDGLYEGMMQLGNDYGKKYNARFLYYHRNSRDENHVIRLMNDSAAFIGVKVGTKVDDVPALVKGVGDAGLVIWGIGDRSTKAAQLGTRGHTSGISVLYAKAGDLINNAQRAGDFVLAQKVEDRIDALEELRFMNGREYNYAAVLEGMILSRFTDIDGGEGGPFNPRVPADISKRVRMAIEGLKDLH